MFITFRPHTQAQRRRTPFDYVGVGVEADHLKPQNIPDDDNLEEIGQVLLLREQNKSLRAIAEELGITLSKVQRRNDRAKKLNLTADIVRRSVRTNYDSTLVTFLRTLFPPETITRLITDYCLGVTRDRSAIFFQLDIQGRCRGGKIIQYNPQTGHRIKDAAAKIPVDWIHPRLKAQGILPASWTMTQCLFGEHLLQRHPNATVVLVEAEKTAVIGSGFVPEFVWVATGGRSGLNGKIDILEGRQILVFPDVDAYDYWKEKLSEHPRLQCYISDYLQRIATPDHPSADIADYLVEYKSLPCHPERSEGSVSPPPPRPEPPIHPIQHILNQPEVAALIADLDLQLTSITKLTNN